MATKLDKDLTRETSVKVNEREVILTLKEDQTINFKLKGMKSGHVGIGINELYSQLTGIESGSTPSATETPEAPVKAGKSTNMISLHDLRHRFNVSGADYETICKVDSVCAELLLERKPKKI
jgi:hypothetical protein